MKFIYLQLIWLFCGMGLSLNVYSQILMGPKAGFQGSVVRYGTLYDGDTLTTMPKLSWQAGGVYQYQVSPLLSFYMELYYSQKGKNLKGKLAGAGIKQHRSVYHFLDIPVLLRFSFPMPELHSQWFLNIGPHAAYWLGGKGSIRAREAIGSPYIYEAPYQIRFQEHDPERDVVYLTESKRLQFGLDFGAGFVFPVNRNGHQKMMLEFRYTWGSTYMGMNEEVQVGNTELTENFSFSNQTFCASLAYVFSWDLKNARKGKSTQKKRR